MDDLLLDPLNAYKTCYRDKFQESAEAHFQDLVNKSQINVEENRKTASDYREQTALAIKSREAGSRSRVLRGFLIFLAIVGFIALGAGIYLLVIASTLAGALCLSLGTAAAVISITVICTVLNRKIKHSDAQAEEYEKQAGELLTKCRAQMAPLNALFESNITKKLIEQTVPLLQIDDRFEMRRLDYLNAKYRFTENADTNASTIGILTGEIQGNPFVVHRSLVHSLGTQTYTGAITISWTTTSRDKDGHIQTHHHTQVLTASVTKPKPFYREETRLLYGNEAAPDLHFSHSPSHAERLGEKALERTVKSGEKKLKKMQNKAMKDDSNNFTAMGNGEFDVLFNAYDRDNEVQFRLLFTPLAQKNMVALMKDAETFGDDFTFDKNGCLNFIVSEHAQTWDMDTDYARYFSYDVDDAHNRFVNFNCTYFKSLFFDLAPLLAIPLYQQHKPKEYIYKETYSRNYTQYEAEYSANKLGEKYFCHDRAQTQSILKTNFLSKNGETDKVLVTAYAYETAERVELIPKLGGDGRMHVVPVPWTEYIPVERDSIVNVKRLDMSDKEFESKLQEDPFRNALDQCGKNRVFTHGLLCCIMENGKVSLDKELENIL